MNEVPESIRKELAALAAKPENDIDFSDLPATTAPDWQGARRGPFYRPVKKQLTVRIDADVLEWLKSQGQGDQRRLNALPRAALLDQKSSGSGKSLPPRPRPASPLGEHRLQRRRLQHPLSPDFQLRRLRARQLRLRPRRQRPETVDEP